jgi:hypothetical protein
MQNYFEGLGLITAALSIVAGLVVGLVLNATGLRIAALWLGLGRIPFRKAISCSLMTFLAPVAIGFQNGFQAASLKAFLSTSDRLSGTVDYMVLHAVSPNLLSSLALLCVVATIVNCVVPTRDAEAPTIAELSYPESIALTVMTMTMTTLVVAILGFAAFAVLSLFVR